MKAVPSTYHQCVKFSYNGVKVTIPSDPGPFQFCANLRGTIAYQVPVNNEATPVSSSKYVDPDQLRTAVKGKIKIEDQGCGEYSMSQEFHIGKLPLSPKSYGRPQPLSTMQPKCTMQQKPLMIFTSGGGLHQEWVYENTSTWVDKSKERQQPTHISPHKYGPRFTIM